LVFPALVGFKFLIDAVTFPVGHKSVVQAFLPNSHVCPVKGLSLEVAVVSPIVSESVPLLSDRLTSAVSPCHVLLFCCSSCLLSTPRGVSPPSSSRPPSHIGKGCSCFFFPPFPSLHSRQVPQRPPARLPLLSFPIFPLAFPGVPLEFFTHGEFYFHSLPFGPKFSPLGVSPSFLHCPLIFSQSFFLRCVKQYFASFLPPLLVKSSACSLPPLPTLKVLQSVYSTYNSYVCVLLRIRPLASFFRTAVLGR